MMLSAHFSEDELTRSNTAIRKCIDNSPDYHIKANLIVLSNGLERVRSALGAPMNINSGYRGPKLNAAVGGSRNSDHMQGLAADFTAINFGTPLEICHWLNLQKDQIGFQQLIHEGRWVHISFSVEAAPKLEILTAHFTPSGVTYTRGLA